MIFLCFSVKDRSIVDIIYNHLLDLGVDVWYDKKNTMIGDNRIYANLEIGAKNKDIKYAIICYSQNFVTGRICVDEYNILIERFAQKNITLFPIFLDGDPIEIPTKYDLCTKLVYKAIKDPNCDYYNACLYILAKIIQDNVVDMKIKTITEYVEAYNNDNSNITKMVIEYTNVSKNNFNLRLGMLYSIFMQISTFTNVTYSHYKAMNHIFHKACIIPIVFDNKEFNIMEGIIMYYLNRLKFA